MRESRIGLWIALGLVVGGTLLLLMNLNGFGEQEAAARVALFAMGGAVFLGVFAQDRRRWWAAIPGCALVGIALAALVDPVAGGWGGLAFLGTIGVGFALVYLSDRDQWWALIPAGALLTVGMVSALPEEWRGGTLFLGLAATFAVVALAAPPAGGRMSWAWFPATALAVLGALRLTGVDDLAGLLWPVALIVVGLFLLLRYLARRRI